MFADKLNNFKGECSLMSRRVLFFVFALTFMLFVFGASAFAEVAVPTASTVLVNGVTVAFDAYNINDNNYFKLRDLAYTLNGTAKQFQVDWDYSYDAISLSAGVPYTVVGGEMIGKGAGEKVPTPTTSKIYLNGDLVSFTAYQIDGNNYFKLRDIGEAFDFGVDYDSDRNAVVIDTSKGYTQPSAGAGGAAGATGTGTATGAGAGTGAVSGSGAGTSAGGNVILSHTVSALGQPEKYTGTQVTIDIISSTEAYFSISSPWPFTEDNIYIDISFNNFSAIIPESVTMAIRFTPSYAYPDIWYWSDSDSSDDYASYIMDIDSVVSGATINRAKGTAEWRVKLPADYVWFNFGMVGGRYSLVNVQAGIDAQ